jgi:hypothetical protein
LAGVDLSTLSSELAKLRTALHDRSSTPEQDMVLGQIAAAETAAKEGNGAHVLQYLKMAGRWAFDVASEIGTSVAAEAIKRALGLA